MKRFALILSTSALLAACSAVDVQTAETDIQTGIAAACHDVLAAKAANPSSPAAPWADACSPTGSASLVQNSATIQWLGGLAVQLAAPAAPVKS